MLFKDSAVLENAHKVTSIVFDKTGTLTMGKPVVTDCVIMNPEKYSEKDFVFFMASGEQGFTGHVLGQAIIDYNSQKYGQALQVPTDFISVAGRGLQCRVREVKVLIGNLAWMTENNILFTNNQMNTITKLEESAKTIICGALDGEICGIFALADTIKPEAAAVVDKLQNQLKIKVWMLTGDNIRTGTSYKRVFLHVILATTIASQLNITNVIAQVKPDEKAEKISELQKNNEFVAMVGDGINDAVALTKANVSIAIGAGTDVAVDSSSVVLMKSDLRDVLICLDLSRKTIRHIRWNFFWAIAYNAISIPLASGAIYAFSGWILPPAAAAALELLSSIPVVVFALLLRLYKAPSI